MAGPFAKPATAQTNGKLIVVDLNGGGDTTSIEDAVRDAPPESTIEVRPGIHVVARQQLLPRRGVRVVGFGWSTVIRPQDGFNRNVFQVHEDAVVIERLRVDGNAANQAEASSNGIYFDAAGGGAVLDCYVHDAAGYGIVGFPGAKSWLVRGNRVFSTSDEPMRSPKEGIELQGASCCVVAANIIEGVRVNGILLWNSTGDCWGNTIVANVITGCGRCGIWLEDGAHHNTVTANVVDGCPVGLRISHHGGAKWRRATISPTTP